jgi:hypothetical protein
MPEEIECTFIENRPWRKELPPGDYCYRDN